MTEPIESRSVASPDGVKTATLPVTSPGASRVAFSRNPHDEVTRAMICKSIKISTWNCCGLDNNQKHLFINTYLRDTQPDLLALTETHRSFTKILPNTFPNYTIISNQGAANARGVSVLMRDKSWLDNSIEQLPIFQTDRHLLISAYHRILKTKLNIAIIYAPNNETERQRFFQALNNQYDNAECHPDIMLGDFNCTMKITERIPQHQHLDKGQPELRELLNCCNLKPSTDICDQDELKNHFTYVSRTYNNTKSIIDKICLSPELFNTCKDNRTIWSHLSDHAILQTTLTTSIRNNAAKPWRLNPKLLTSENITELEANLPDSAQIEPDKVLLEWGNVKMLIQHHFEHKGRKQAKVNQTRFKTLQKRLHVAETKSRPTDHILCEMKEIWDQLSSDHKQRARQRWQSLGEKPTRYFFNILKEKRQHNVITALKPNSDAEPISDPQGMSDISQSFFQKLYSPESFDEHQQTNLINQVKAQWASKQLTYQENDHLLSEVTLKELNMAINAMKNNKAPGPDGIIVELYKRSEKLQSILLKVINHLIREKELPHDLKKGLIILLYKKGDETLLKNYRPITLLNTDYKIITRTLNNRLIKVLKDRIDEDQHAFLPERSIHDNICQIQSLLKLADIHQTPGALLFLDQEKAYDRVLHDLIWRTMDAMGFNQNFINIIKSLYSGATSSVSVNGNLSEPIPITRGVRQGDALSCLLYVIAHECLMTAIKSSPLRGLSIANTPPTLIKAYADDTVIALNNKDELKTTLTIIKNYERATNAKINHQKSELLLLYKMDDLNTNTNLKIVKHGEPSRHLGCPVGIQLSYKETFDNLVNKISDRIRKLNLITLTLEGRVLAINSIISPKIWYMAQHIPFSKGQISKLQTLLFKTLKQSDKPGINISTFQLPKHKGGLNFISIENRLKTLYITKALRMCTHQKSIASKYINAIFTSQLQKTQNPNIAVSNPWLQTRHTSTTFRPTDIWLPVWKTWTEFIELNRQCVPSKDLINAYPLWYSELLYDNGGSNKGNVLLRDRRRLQTVGDLLQCDILEIPPILSVYVQHNPILKIRYSRPQHTLPMVNAAHKLKSKIPNAWQNRLNDNTLDPDDTTHDCWSNHLCFKTNNINFSLNCSQLTHKIYEALCLMQNKPLLPDINQDNTKFESHNKYFTNLWNLNLNNRRTLTIWKFLINRLKNNARLFNLPENETLCTFCNTYAESREHLFFECVHTKPLLKIIEKLIQKVSNHPDDIKLTWEQIHHFTILKCEPKKYTTQIRQIIAIFIYSIWILRCNVKHKNSRVDSANFLSIFNNALEQELNVQYRNTLYKHRNKEPVAKFHETWNISVCSINNRNIVKITH
jgi:hypothetical protein